MQAKLEIFRKTGDLSEPTLKGSPRVRKKIDLKPGVEVWFAALPVEALPLEKDKSGKVQGKRFAPVPNARHRPTGEWVVDGYINVKAPDIIEFVQITQVKPIGIPVPHPKIFGLEEVVATFHDDGSIREIPVYVTEKVGATKLPVEFEARIVSKTPGREHREKKAAKSSATKKAPSVAAGPMHRFIHGPIAIPPKPLP